MRLENEPQKQQPLTQDDVSAILDRAMARQREEEQQTVTGATLEDALEIARSLSIPEEHVLAAAEEIRRRKLAEADLGSRLALREKKRSLLRQQRRAGYGATAAILLGLGLTLGVLTSAAGWIVVIPMIAGIWAAIMAFLPISDAAADRVELPPTPGVCRVCGEEAITRQGTFCEEHRYRSPG